MTDVSTYPLEDWFETTLAQEWDGATGTVYVNSTPDFTFPSGVTTYIVVNPGKSTMQLAEVDSYDSAANTFNITNVTLNKGAGSSYSQETHAVGSVVRISDNFEFWSELVTAINTKVDGNVRWFPAYADDTARDAAITTPVNGMMIYNTADGVLQQYISGGWADVDAWSTPNASETVAGKVEIATDAEITSWSWTWVTWAVLSVTPTQLKKSISLKNSISSTDETDEFVVNDGWEDKRITKANLRDDLAASTTVKGTVEMCTDAEAAAGTDETRYINAKQLADNAGGVTVDVVNFTRSLSAASWTVNISHSLWVAPKMIVFVCESDWGSASTRSRSDGAYDGSNNLCTLVYNWGSRYYQSSSESIIASTHTSTVPSVNDGQFWAVTATSTTDFTITWTKQDSPSGTAYITAYLYA